MDFNKDKTLLLFTTTYPFGKANEVYIDNEINFLTEAFKEVIIVPMNYTQNSRISIPNAAPLEINKYAVFSKRLIVKKIGLFISMLIWESGNKNSEGIISNAKKIYNALVYAEAVDHYINEKGLHPSKVVMYSYWFYHWSLVIAILKRKHAGIKAISRAHLQDIYGEFNKDSFTGIKLKYLDYIFPISGHGANYFKHKFPEYESKIKACYLGVKDRGMSRAVLEQGKFVVVSCSIIRKDKRIDKIVEVLSHIKFPITWVHFGNGPLFEEIKSASEKLPSNVTVELKGYVQNNLVGEYYLNNQVNLFLNFSSAEGIPVSIMEAISFGIPVVATAVYGTPEAVTGKSGELIELDFDSAEVANKITKFMHSNRNTEMFRKGVRVFWEENFNAQTNYKNFTRLITSQL